MAIRVHLPRHQGPRVHSCSRVSVVSFAVRRPMSRGERVAALYGGTDGSHGDFDSACGVDAAASFDAGDYFIHCFLVSFSLLAVHLLASSTMYLLLLSCCLLFP